MTVADYVLTHDDIQAMEYAARRFSGAYTGTSGQLAGFVILLIQERQRLLVELARKENAPPNSYET